MNMKARFTTLAAFALALGTAAEAVTLDDYLKRVRASHPMFARENMQGDIERGRRESLLGAQDWQLVSSPSFRHREPPQASPFDPERVDELYLDAGVSRSFWGSGSRLSMGWTTNVLDQDLPGFSIPAGGGVIEIPIGPSTYYTHALTATYSIPLLKNRGGLLDRLGYDLAEFDVELAEVNAAENQETFLLDVAMKYLDWVLADEQLKIARDRLELAEEELVRTKRKRASYLVDEADVLRAEDAVQVARGAVLLVQSGWTAARAELASLAGWDEEEQGSPSFDPYDLPARPDAAAARDAIAQTRAIRAIDLQASQLAEFEKGLGESTRPELAAIVSGSLIGADADFDRSLEMKHPDLLVGLEFRYPIGNRAAEADVQTARLQRRQLDLARRSVEVTLEASLRAIVSQLEELEGVLALNVERLDTARRKTSEEIDLYNQGRGDLTFVIQSRDNEARAKLAYAENSLLYHKLSLQYRALADRLLTGGVN
jgi:outer membrane protein TolC